MDAVIKTENLSKHYGKLIAVNNVSLHVRKGEIYGFLGLNGAGKTTTIRMLLGLIGPTTGNAWLNGIKVSPGNARMWNNVGYLVEIPNSYPNLTVRENLEIVRRMRLMTDQEPVKGIIEKLRLGQYSNIIARNLSQGNAQRLGLAKALLHSPEILLLDEPSNGLDPAGIVEIREMLKDLAKNKGVTIFISSHILGEISKFATRIGIINNGLLIRESSVKEMEILREKCLQIKTRDPDETKRILESNSYSFKTGENGIIQITGEEALQNPEKIAELLVKSGHPPLLLRVDEEDLESFFLRVISLKGGDK